MDKLHLVSSVDQIRMAPPDSADGLPLTIPYTSTDMARQALRAAENLSRGLNVSVRLVAVQIVPFPCPVNRPPVALHHIAGPLERLAAEADIPVEVNIVLARDATAGYLEVLPHDSLVLMAARKRWWPTREMRLARRLARARHSVVVITGGEAKPCRICSSSR
jgi:hypothetical protein